MEYQGIITGIGDKDENINIITPEIDAVLNDYIIGKNAVIEGLEVSGYDTLTAGMCVLKGYRGVLPNAITVGAGTNGNYIYGKFVLNFNNTVDEFYIEVTNDVHTSPASITNAGTYYLLLYYFEGGDWVPALDEFHNYPNKAFEADETGVLLDYGVIAPTTETETADENAHLTTPLRVANTEYVHNQIEEEIAYATETISIYRTETSNVLANCVLQRKAKCIMIKSTGNSTGLFTYRDENYSISIPQGFLPKVSESCVVFPVLKSYTEGSYPVYCVYLVVLTLNPQGQIVRKTESELQKYTQQGSGESQAREYIRGLTFYSGYETN